MIWVPGCTTPPSVWAASAWTRPESGARTTTRCELVGERLALLLDLGQLGLDLAHLVDDALREFLLALGDLESASAMAPCGAGDVGDEAADVAFEPRLLALQAAEPLLIGEALGEQRLDVGEFLVGELQLAARAT